MDATISRDGYVLFEQSHQRTALETIARLDFLGCRVFDLLADQLSQTGRGAQAVDLHTVLSQPSDHVGVDHDRTRWRATSAVGV